MQIVLFRGISTWPQTKENFSRIQHSDNAMTSLGCGIWLEQPHATNDLGRKLCMHHIKEVLFVRWCCMDLENDF